MEFGMSCYLMSVVARQGDERCEDMMYIPLVDRSGTKAKRSLLVIAAKEGGLNIGLQVLPFSNVITTS